MAKPTSFTMSWSAIALLSPLLLVTCGQPSDLERARAVIDSSLRVQRADSITRAQLADSLRDGPHTYRDKQGRLLMEGTIQNGLREGIWTSYSPSGKVKSRTEFVNGQPHGLSTVFHENGAVYYSGNHRNGKPTGPWRFFDPQGGLAKSVLYDTTGAVINDR